VLTLPSLNSDQNARRRHGGVSACPAKDEKAAGGLQRWISKESIGESLIDAIELFAD
jgi:hypothetical protein